MDNNSDVVVLPPEIFANAALTTQIDERVMTQQLEHQATLEEWTDPFQLIKTGKYWWKGTRLVVVDNNALRRWEISLFPDSKTAGHPGITKTVCLTSQDFWWPNMKNDITNYVQGSATCQSN